MSYGVRLLLVDIGSGGMGRNGQGTIVCMQWLPVMSQKHGLKCCSVLAVTVASL